MTTPADRGATGGAASPAGAGESQASQGSEETQTSAGAKSEDGGQPGESHKTDAADQPGRGSSRQRYFEEARRMFAGDSVAGDKFVFYLTGGQPAPLRRLSPSLEDLARRAFVTPQEWEKSRLDFRRHSTVILRGQRGHGRMTMAIRLLQTVEAKVIYQLDPQVDIKRMAEQINSQAIEPGTAFLLNQPSDFAQLDAYTFESLEAALGEHAHLVITVGTDCSLRDDGLLKYLIDLPSAPQLQAILRSHLDFHFRQDEGRAERVLALPEVTSLISEMLVGGEATCEFAAFIALVLSWEDDRLDIARVRDLLRRRGDDEFDIWFESLPDLEVRCFAIALAVLNGLPFEDVADAARRLHEHLAEADAVVVTDKLELRTRSRDPFSVNADMLLRTLQARIELDDVRVALGRVTTDTIAYRNPQYPRQIIERAWKGFLIQDRLLAWLDELVTYGSDRVRVFASTTLGVLSTFAFDHVSRGLFQSWAVSDHWWHREAVADALRVTAADPALQPRVMTMVNGWYGRRSSPAAQSTAAIAYGTGLGLQHRTAPFDALWRLAIVDDLEVHIMIGRGLTTLLAEDAKGLALEMYHTLTRCVDDRRRYVAGHRAFLVVANDLITEVSASGDTVEWPTLLHLAAQHEQLRSPLSYMWAKALDDGESHDLASQVVRNWATLAEPDEVMREVFTRLARDIRRVSPQSGAALVRLARQWNSDDELLPLPQISKSVLRGVLA